MTSGNRWKIRWNRWGCVGSAGKNFAANEVAEIYSARSVDFAVYNFYFVSSSSKQEVAFMVDSNAPRQASDVELVEIADRQGPCISIDDAYNTLRDALVRAAQISGSGRTPFKLKRPATNTEVDHAQMLRLWKLLGMLPEK
jgi:hypothetical protein